ncbi:hypothetical protein AAHE33_000420 [Klebsiella aerogenes]
MNNEIEQIAQQNDMSIEFVRWFFNEKKADCSEQWFLALGAMWEGWKAREGEVTALALTLEKSREASGCPAGVDLQDWVKKLAAENAGLAAENKMAVDAVTVFSNVKHDVTEIICDELGRDRVAEIVAAYNDLGNMPATDRIVAGIKADGATATGDYLKLEAQHMPVVERLMMQDTAEICYGTAARLREGADK